MWRLRIAVILVAALALAGLPVASAQGQQVRVIVDGSPVAFDQPPVVMGGRVLIPLRGVLERLGATVEWNPMNGMVLASTGTTQIQLTIGSRQAWVNGRQVMLDVPAMVMNGRTLVPLRFISESLGASVDWLPATRMVMITSGRAVQPPSPPVVQPPQPPVPSRSVIEGTVFRVDVANSRLFVQRGDQIYSIAITPNTAITVVNTATGQGGAVSLGDLTAGDAVTVTLNAQNQAILVRAQTREVTGRIDAVAGRTIVLSDGQVFTLAENARILIGGREAALSDLRVGTEVSLRLNPQTGQVLEVSAQAVAQGPVRITSFTHNVTRPLRAGEIITVVLRGTAGGQATFDIFNVASGIPMRETAPGVYEGSYTVQAGNNIANAAIFGHLRVGGQEAVIQSGVNVTLDAQAPVITGRYPQPNSVVENMRPNIMVTFVDQGPGVNTAASALLVNGQNVTANATVTETAIAYTPPSNLPQGAVTVEALIGDRAGNQTRDRWTFTIGAVQGSIIQAVTLNPPGPLRTGQTLTVTALGRPGAQASFTIEGVAQNIPMTAVSGQPGVYVGQYTVQAQNNVQNARVLVTMSSGGQTQTVAATSALTLIGSQTQAPTIISPAPGARVTAPIVIRGTAQPGSRVVVRVDYRGSLLLFNVSGTYGEVTTAVDANGNWEVSIQPTIRIPNATLTVIARAIDPLGVQSAPVQVQVTQS